MPNFGDVLRGLGSVLNPQVMQSVEQEDQRREQFGNQLGLMMLQKQIEQQSPEYQMKMEALKNERGYRTAMQDAGGDPVKMFSAAATFGKPEVALSLMKSTEDRALREREMLLRHEDRSTAATNNYELRRSQIALMEKQGADKDELARMRLDLDRSAKEMSNQLAAERNQILLNQGKVQQQMLDMRLAQQNQGRDQQTQRQTMQLSGALEKAGLNEVRASIDDAEQALAKAPNIAEYLTGPKSTIPDWMVSKEIRDARQALTRVFNITLKARSGAAVTNQELDRLKQEFGQGAFKTADQLTGAFGKMKGIVTSHYQGIAAGFSPEALKMYNENLEAIGGAPFVRGGASSGSPSAPPPPPGFVRQGG